MICASRHTVLYNTSACQCMTGYWGGECRDKCGNCFREWFWRRTHPLPSAIGGAAWKWTATWQPWYIFSRGSSVSVWWVYKLWFEAAWWIIFCFHQWMLFRTLASFGFTTVWQRGECFPSIGKVEKSPGKHCGSLGRSRMQPCHRNPRQLWLNYASDTRSYFSLSMPQLLITVAM